MNKKCEHKWVNMEDGSLDKLCVRCRKFAMQAQMAIPATVSANVSAAQPILRETTEMPFYNGSEHIRISVYKDDLIKQMQKEIGLPMNCFNSAGR